MEWDSNLKMYDCFDGKAMTGRWGPSAQLSMMSSTLVMWLQKYWPAVQATLLDLEKAEPVKSAECHKHTGKAMSQDTPCIAFAAQ